LWTVLGLATIVTMPMVQAQQSATHVMRIKGDVHTSRDGPLDSTVKRGMLMPPAPILSRRAGWLSFDLDNRTLWVREKDALQGNPPTSKLKRTPGCQPGAVRSIC
jgi:hypothetical protein